MFGLVTFRPYKEPDSDFWVGSVYFKPLDRDVDIYLSADYKGPTTSQREFYRKVENQYTQYMEQAKPLLVEAFKDHDEPFSPTDLNHTYILDCISIPALDEVPAEWDLEFVSVDEESLFSFLVELKDDRVTDVALG